MIKEIKSHEKIKEALDYIGNDYKSIPYLYVNLIKYGLGSEKVSGFTDLNEAGGIEGIFLKYYDCIHFYTKDVDAYPVERLVEFVRNTEHRVIILQGIVGNRVEKRFPGYFSERNYVMDMDKTGLEGKDSRSEIAVREDIEQIVDLLMSDAEYIDVYDSQVLSDQLHSRFDDGFSRFFVIKTDGKVVATCSTYGEVPGFAIVGGVIVHPDYRRRGLAADVERYACHILEQDKKSRVAFVNYHNKPSLALHKKMGGFSIGTLAKFIKKRNGNIHYRDPE